MSGKSKANHKRLGLASAFALAVLTSPVALAINFNFGSEGEATINTTITLDAGWRMQDRALDLVRKANLDPGVCGGQFQSCQGLFRDQSFTAARLAAAPGHFSPNFDDGNWNYDKGDMFSGVAKVTQDITLTWGDSGVFVKSLFFYDEVNNNFEEYHPNIITADNVNEVGLRNPLLNPTGTQDVGGLLTLNPIQYGAGRPERFKRRGGDLL